MFCADVIYPRPPTLTVSREVLINHPYVPFDCLEKQLDNGRDLIQGVRKFPPQLCQALASSYLVTMKYPFNHVILTPREFF